MKYHYHIKLNWDHSKMVDLFQLSNGAPRYNPIMPGVGEKERYRWFKKSGGRQSILSS